MRDKVLPSVVLSCTLLLTVSAAAVREQTAIASRGDDEIKLMQPAQVGDLTLQPDTYVVQHHASHGEDFIRFLQVKKIQKLRLTRAYTGWYTDTELIKAGDVKCRVQPLSEKIQATAATMETEGGKSRITKIMIKGKRAVYLF